MHARLDQHQIFRWRRLRAPERTMSAFVKFKSPEHLVSDRLVGTYEAWKRTATGRMAPKREEITPALLRSVLPWIWMIDVVEGGADFRFRLAGDRIVQFMGRRYAGLMLSDHLDGPFFQRMRAVLVECLSRKAPVAVGPVRTNLPGKQFLEMEVVVTPLSEDGDTISCLFGAMDVRGLDPTAK
jgi:hypothetical protein